MRKHHSIGSLHSKSNELRCVLVSEPDLGVARITYNEDSNVIMTVTGNASRSGGSEILCNQQLFLGYRPMGLSKNSACLKILNRQKQIKLSENSVGS